MTYWQFHLVFTIPQTILLSFLLPKILKTQGKVYIITTFILAIVAFIYTTPWDNYLVYKEVWGYPEDRVSSTWFYVPVEEYFFFIIQSFFTAFLLGALLFKIPMNSKSDFRSVKLNRWLAFLFLVASIICIFLMQWDSLLYLSLILSWSLPIFALQFYFGGDLLVKMGKVYPLGIIIPSLYLSLADSYAINKGVWYLSETYTMGIKIFNLPIEEIIFFFVTNAMLVQGLLLVLHPESFVRLAKYKNMLLRAHRSHSKS